MNYKKEIQILRNLIPDDQYHSILSQYYCEYEPDFLGFINVYGPISRMVPKDKVIIDLGCYLAAQSWCFAEHKRYIGVDTDPLDRFAPPNATHLKCSIQDFLSKELPELLQQYSMSDLVAICSYVPDFSATDAAYEAFENIVVVYPGQKTKTKGIVYDQNFLLSS